VPRLIAVTLAFAVGLARADEPSTPPAQLRCLERHLGAAPVARDGRWFARLADGTLLPWDTGERPPAERLEHPDLKDLFAQRYPRGPIQPVTTVDEDPGRVRLEPLYRAAYPARERVRARFFGHPVELHRRAAAALARVEERLRTVRDPAATAFWEKLGGSLNERVIAGTTRTSAHAWGIALDLNPALSHYWRWERGGWKNRVPQSIVDAFEAEGFIWGGRWYHFDTMHFEFRPELLDPSCYPPG
jgi:hypothetical protein